MWKEVTEERYWDMMEVLFPTEQIGDAFLIGEPYSSDDDGNPTYFAFRKLGPVYQESLEPMTVKQFRKQYCIA